jgi:hypothetical protein
MSRNLRLAHLPPMHARLRFSGFITDPTLTDAKITDALSPFLLNMKLWRSAASLPADWPTRDDTVITDPPAGVVPFWGEGDDVTTASVIGDPQTPWRVLAGQGQVVIDNVWLYDANADPWPANLAPCPTCPACPTPENVTPPSAPCSTFAVGVLGAALGATATAGFLWWRARA